jgi:hypothetical protein
MNRLAASGFWAYSAGTAARFAPVAPRRIKVWEEAGLGPIYKEGSLPSFIAYDNVLYHTRSSRCQLYTWRQLARTLRPASDLSVWSWNTHALMRIGLGPVSKVPAALPTLARGALLFPDPPPIA